MISFQTFLFFSGFINLSIILVTVVFVHQFIAEKMNTSFNLPMALLDLAWWIFQTFLNIPVIIFFLIYGAEISSLNQWNKVLKSNVQGITSECLLNYWTAIDLANETFSSSIFHVTLALLVNICMVMYRGLTFTSRKFKTKKKSKSKQSKVK